MKIIWIMLWFGGEQLHGVGRDLAGIAAFRTEAACEKHIGYMVAHDQMQPGEWAKCVQTTVNN